MADSDLDWRVVTDWFGYMPSFHDAEVVEIILSREPKPSLVRVHAFRSNVDLDSDGCFRRDRHALVTFSFSVLIETEIEGWNHQNALMSLSVSKIENGYQLDMAGAYGVGGYIRAQEIRVALEPWNGEEPFTAGAPVQKHSRI